MPQHPYMSENFEYPLLRECALKIAQHTNLINKHGSEEQVVVKMLGAAFENYVSAEMNNAEMYFGRLSKEAREELCTGEGSTTMELNLNAIQMLNKMFEAVA